MDFLANTQPVTLTTEQLVGGGAAVPVILLLVRWVDRLLAQKSPPKFGGTNGFGKCSMTKEANDVILEKDGKGNRLSHFKLQDITEQHRQQDEKAEKSLDRLDAHCDKIGDTLLKVATILEGIERRQG